MIKKAISFAAKKHEDQVRKGTFLPFIVHPMEVMYLLCKSGADENTIVAGILHDTVEDTDTTIEEIEIEFGSEIASYVAAETEDKEKTWEERKSEAIKKIADECFNVKLISCADKLSNLESILDAERLGIDIWSYMKGTKEKSEEYYMGMINGLSSLQGLEIYDQLKKSFSLVFGKKQDFEK
jgi:(p)ppGpp synthase/HD superfamily hydrolase